MSDGISKHAEHVKEVASWWEERTTPDTCGYPRPHWHFLFGAPLLHALCIPLTESASWLRTNASRRNRHVKSC